VKPATKPLDLKALSAEGDIPLPPVDASLPLGRAGRRELRTIRGGFTVLPYAWSKRLLGADSSSAWRLAVCLLDTNFDSKLLTFKLTNGMAAAYWMTKYQKLRALRELESSGLITVEWRESKAPIVTLHHVRTPRPSGRSKTVA
jgi:hypothetical protein